MNHIEQFDTADEAIQDTYASGRGTAITLCQDIKITRGGKIEVMRAGHYNVSDSLADSMAVNRIDFAYLHLVEKENGDLLTVTVPNL